MTDQTKKPQAGQSPTDVPKQASGKETQASENRERISEVLEKHRGEIRQIIKVLRSPQIKHERIWKYIEEAKRIKQSLPAGIGLFQSPEYEKAVKSRFFDNLRLGNIDFALEIRKEFGQGIDFANSKGYKEATRYGFLKCLRKGQINRALKIFNKLSQEIDFTKFEGYLGAVTTGFLASLKEGQAKEAIRIRDWLGQGIDFAKLKEYGDAVRAGFLNCLRNGWIDRAIKIHKEFGQGTVAREATSQGFDFAKLEGYGEAVKAGFLHCLRNGLIDRAIEIRDDFGKGIDFTKETRSYFLNCLRNGWIDRAVEIRDVLGKRVDLTDEIKSGVLQHMREGRADIAIKIRDLFGRGIDLRKDSEYRSALIAFCEKQYPDFHNYLTTEEANESAVKKYRNEFWAKSPRDITPTLLLKFESLVVSADGFMRKAMKDKVRSLGADPEKPDWGERLTEEQKGEVGAFMDNLQTQIRAKLQTIASTEVIRAYMDREGRGMGWMEVA